MGTKTTKLILFIIVLIASSTALSKYIRTRKIETKYCYFQGPNAVIDKQIFIGGKNEISKIVDFYNQRLMGYAIHEIDFNSSGTGLVPSFSMVDVLKYMTPDSSIVKIRSYNKNSKYKKLDTRENVSYTLNICLHDTLPQINE